MAFTFHTGPYPTVGVPNTTTTGHDGTDGSIKTGAGKLILSSSANIIHVSASLDLGTTPERAYHIRAVNANLVLSCSAGSIVSLSASQDFANSDKAYHIRAANSHLILSSSAGSIVQISGGLLLAGTYTSSTLPTAPPTGSIVYVSDLGFAAIYVNSVDKYMRISSGTF
jgi:hypothetical protein